MRPPNLEEQLQAALVAEQWTEYERLAALMDAEDERERQRRESVTLAAAALWYATQGLWVFPLKPGLKRPYEGSHGLDDATTDLSKIRSWWKFQPDSNIGIATGHLVDVIDIDGPVGNQTLANMTNVPDRLGWAVSPRPGGRHLYIAAHPDRGNKAKILPGIDYRGLGGYVVAPPSVIAPGGDDYPGRYEWVRPLDLTAVEEEPA